MKLPRCTFAVTLLILTACQPVQGPAGPPGSIGPQGERGPAGEDANPVKVVKLCPDTAVYPTTFVEVAFCIEGVLYGTYSANGGFSTELPPGAYSSNAIGSSCSFNVLPNCEVTQ